MYIVYIVHNQLTLKPRVLRDQPHHTCKGPSACVDFDTAGRSVHCTYVGCKIPSARTVIGVGWGRRHASDAPLEDLLFPLNMYLMRSTATDKIEHRNVLCAHDLNKEPGLLRVLHAQRKSSCWFDLSWKLFQETALGFFTPDAPKNLSVKLWKFVKIVEKPHDSNDFEQLCWFCPTPTNIFACSWLAKNKQDENSMTRPLIFMIGNIKFHWWIHTCAKCKRKMTRKKNAWKKTDRQLWDQLRTQKTVEKHSEIIGFGILHMMYIVIMSDNLRAWPSIDIYIYINWLEKRGHER